VNVVRHQVAFFDPAFFLLRQLAKHLSLSETQSCWQLISNRAMLLPYARGL
jgi:hypothetical protein